MPRALNCCVFIPVTEPSKEDEGSTASTWEIIGSGRERTSARPRREQSAGKMVLAQNKSENRG